MRYIALFATAVALAAPSFCFAQYDFDDFMTAVAAGQNAESESSPRLAQVSPTDIVGSGTAHPVSPVPMEMLESTESIPMPAPASVAPDAAPTVAPPQTAAPQQINFEHLFAQQDVGLADPTQIASRAGVNCDSNEVRSECTSMPYYQPNLPAPASLRGYFRASPCVANVWDGYTCESAKACMKIQSAIAPPVAKGNHSNCGSGSCP